MPAQPKTTTRTRSKSPAARKKPRKGSPKPAARPRKPGPVQDGQGDAAAGGELHRLPIGDIDPCPFQTRTFPHDNDADDPGLQELAQSILATGLLQPILVRPLRGRYQLGAGERRLRASKLAGCTNILALVRELDDDQLAEVVAVENLQRCDLPPLEAAASVALLLRRPGWTAGDVAERIGRSTSYVSRLAKLDDLTPAWRAVIATPDHPANGWSVAHLVAVARLAPDVQDDALASHKSPDSWFWRKTASGLEQQLAEFTRRLAQAPWSPRDPDLLPEAGACLACVHRSSRHPGLFDDGIEDADPDTQVPPNDRCLDDGCWSRKLQRWLAKRQDELLEKHPDLHLVSGWLPDAKRPERWLPEYTITPTRKKTEGAIPCLRIGGGGQVGEFFWATRDRAPVATEPAPVTGARLRSDLAAVRRHRFLDLLATTLERAPVPADELLLALILGLHGHRPRYGLDALHEAATLWSSLEDLRTAGDLHSVLWTTVVRPQLLERSRNLAGFAQNALDRCQWDQEAEEPDEVLQLLWDELERIASVVGASADDLRRQVADAIPDPPEWDGLADDQDAPHEALESWQRLLER